MPEKPTYEELAQRVRELEASESKSKKMLEALHQKESLYQNIFKHMLHEVHVWKLVFDDHGNVKTWKLADANPAALKSWNRTLPEIVGKTTDEIFPDSNATELFMPVVEKIYREGTPHRWESYFPDTQQVLHMISVSFGEYFISTGFDITERKRAEDALCQNNEMLKRTEAIAHVGSWVWEIATDKVTWSEELYRIFQFDPDSEAPNWAEHPKLYHPKDFKKLRQAVETAMTDEKPYELELRILRKDGETRVCKTMGFGETGKDGHVVRLFGLLQDITDRKRAEEDLSQIFAMSLDMISIADINTATFIKVNPAFTEILGYSEEELLEKPFLDFIHPDDIDSTLKVIEKRLKLGAKIINFENRYRCKDGSYRWLSWVGHPNLENGVTYSVARDITEWKQHEEELRKSKDLLDATGLMAKVGGWELDADTLEVIWTKETYRIHEVPFGYNPPLQEAINFFHPEDRPQLEKAIQIALNHGEPFDLRLRFITAYGKHLWTRIKCEPEVLDGKVVKLIGTFQDITELKAGEKALIESEKRYKHLYENAQVGLGRTRIADGRILNCNNKMAEIFGYSNKNEFIKDYILSENYVDKSLRERFLSEISVSGFISNREAEFLRRNGKTVWVRFDTKIFPDQDFLEDVIIDITEQKIAEKERTKLQDQLQQAQKFESIGTLASGIAHDFNNILTSVIGYTELALEEAAKGTALEDSLQEVYSAGKRAKDLVKQILAFARQSKEKRSPIQPSVIVKEILKFIRSTIPSSIEIRQDIQSSSLVMGNDTQIHQVLMNICTNAAHAMEEAGGVLELSLRDIVIDKADYLEIKVSDTGVGIAPELMGSIFEPYFTTKGPGEGTGMGLATTHGIVDSYGGKISVESKLGKGTTFTIYLPVTKNRSTHGAYIPEQLPTGSERILFVDDEAPIAKMGGQIFERLGYSVTIRTSSIEALELFKTKPNDFDLVVTDMTMPNMTGDRLAIELMKIRSSIPVILCTGYSKKISDKIALEIGIKALAYKPVVKADLAKIVRKVLDEAKSKSHASLSDT